MKFFDPGEPSLTLSQCWSFPRDAVFPAPELIRDHGEAKPGLPPAGTCRSVVAPAAVLVGDSIEDAGNP